MNLKKAPAQGETLTLTAEEVRFATDDAGTFTGYASVFGEPDSFGDTIKPGAFRKTLSERKRTGGPAMFWNHTQMSRSACGPSLSRMSAA